jgi:hypothetical protein
MTLPTLWKPLKEAQWSQFQFKSIRILVGTNGTGADLPFFILNRQSGLSVISSKYKASPKFIVNSGLRNEASYGINLAAK